MVDILICDDNKYARKMLEKLSSENLFITTIFTAKDGIDAVSIVQQNMIDIAFLDIDMPHMNGIDVAKLISKISPKTKFIFITAHAEYAIESFIVHPYDYILKPIDIDNFNNVLTTLAISIRRTKQQTSQSLTIKENQVLHIIHTNEILYIEKEDRVVRIHTSKNSVTFNKTLSEMEKILDKNFVRTHKSFIVNRTRIEKIIQVGNTSYQIRFRNSEKTALMSRHKYDDLVKSLPNM